MEIGPLAARLIIRLEKPQSCYVSMAEVGLDQADLLPILSTSAGDMLDGKIVLSPELFDGEGKVTLEVELTREVKGGYLVTVEVDEP